MSYSIWAYLIDLDRLYHIYGSHDTALVAAIESQLPDRVARFNENIDDYNYEKSSLEAPIQPSVNEAMRMSIAGRMPLTELDFCNLIQGSCGAGSTKQSIIDL